MQSLFGDDDSFELGSENQEGRCTHAHQVLVTGAFGPHVAKMVCSDCDRMVRWVSKLEAATIEAKAKLAKIWAERGYGA